MNSELPARIEWEPLPETEIETEAPPPKRLPLAFLLAFLSATAAFAHQILWQRRLVDWLGAGTVSMGGGALFPGLAFGAWLAARWQIARPWRGVALAQWAVAAMAAGVIAGSKYLTPSIESAGPWIKGLLPVLLIAPPSFAMGLMLPWMARAVGSQRAVWLFSLTMLGGGAGVVLTLPGALPVLGLAATSLAALALTGLCALSAGTFFRNAPLQPPVPQIARRGADLETLGFGAGFLGLGAVVIVQHQFAQVSIAAEFSSAGLWVFMLLAAGVSAALVPLVARLWPNSMSCVLTLAALACASEPFLFAGERGGLSFLPYQLGPWIYSGSAFKLVGTSLTGFLLPAAMVFPLLTRLRGAPRKLPLGTLLAFHCAGAWMGAQFTTLVLAPLFGLWESMSVLAVGYAIAALCFASRRAFFILGLGLTLAVCESLRIDAPLPEAALAPNERLLDWELGAEGLVAAVETAPDHRRLFFNNTAALGGSREQFNEERRGLLPILLHGQARKVATLGMATGSTAAGITLDPGVESIEAIEASPLALRFAREFFAGSNRGVFENPRVQLTAEDPRFVIARRPKAFDVVVGDLFLPWRNGEGRMFSRDHFAHVRESLKEDGLFCQWLPMCQLTRVQFKSIARTFQEVFPEAWLVRGDFYTDTPVLGLIGGRRLEDQDWQRTKIACERLRATTLSGDPLLRHVEGVAMCLVGPLPASTPGPLNTLSNAWLQSDAGINLLGLREPWFTGVPCATFLRDIQRSSTARLPSDLRAAHVAGQSFLTLEIARTARLPNLARLEAETQAAMPAALREDKGADWKEWPMRRR